MDSLLKYVRRNEIAPSLNEPKQDVYAKIQPRSNIISTLNKINNKSFNDNINQKGSTIYLSKQDFSRAITPIEIVLKKYVA